MGDTSPNRQVPQAGGIFGQVVSGAEQLSETGQRQGQQLFNRAGQLNQFQPLDPAAQGTLGGIIQTGNPVDVSGITDAALSEGQRSFRDLSGGIEEQLGALGLGSSSARTAALGQAAGDVSSRIGEAGLRAGVGAQENAAQRQISGLGTQLGASGQQLGAKQSALQGQLGARGLGLQASGQGLQTGAGQSSQAIQALLAAQRNQLAGGGGGFSGSGRSGGFGADPGRSPFRAPPQGGVPQSFQEGGRVDPVDFLSNLAFGVKFNQPSGGGSFGGGGGFSGPSPQSSLNAERQRLREAQNFGTLQNNLFKNRAQFQDSLSRQREIAGRRREIGQAGQLARSLASTPFNRSTQGTEELFTSIQGTGLQNAIQGLRQTGQLLGRQKGGEIQGPAVPPDTVPILAQGGELIVPVGLRAKIENSKSVDPLVSELKDLIARPADADQSMQEGGSVFEKLRQGQLFDALVGQSPQEISTEVASGGSPFAGAAQSTRPDLATHALVSQKIADRVGVPVARVLGVGNEVLGGLLSAVMGQGFTGETGFDLADLNANEVGFEAARAQARPSGTGARVGQVTRPGASTTIRGQQGGTVPQDAVGLDEQGIQEFMMMAEEMGVQQKQFGGLLSGIPPAVPQRSSFFPQVEQPGQPGPVQQEQVPQESPILQRVLELIQAQQQPEVPLSTSQGQVELPPGVGGAPPEQVGLAQSDPAQGFAGGQRSFTNADLGQDISQGGFVSSGGLSPERLAKDEFNNAQARVDNLDALILSQPIATTGRLKALRDDAAKERDKIVGRQQSQQAIQLESQAQEQALLRSILPSLISQEGLNERAGAQREAVAGSQQGAARQRLAEIAAGIAGKDPSAIGSQEAFQAKFEQILRLLEEAAGGGGAAGGTDQGLTEEEIAALQQGGLR